MVAKGSSKEAVARALWQARRDLGVKYKSMTLPDVPKEILNRNLEKYGDELGPSIEWLRNRNISWDDIIESAKTAGKEYNDLAGIQLI